MTDQNGILVVAIENKQCYNSATERQRCFLIPLVPSSARGYIYNYTLRYARAWCYATLSRGIGRPLWRVIRTQTSAISTNAQVHVEMAVLHFGEVEYPSTIHGDREANPKESSPGRSKKESK